LPLVVGVVQLKLRERLGHVIAAGAEVVTGRLRSPERKIPRLQNLDIVVK